MKIKDEIDRYRRARIVRTASVIDASLALKAAAFTATGQASFVVKRFDIDADDEEIMLMAAQ